MHKRVKRFVVLSLLFVFLSSISARETLAKPDEEIKCEFDIRVVVLTGPPEKCPHWEDPVEGAKVNVKVSYIGPGKKLVKPGEASGRTASGKEPFPPGTPEHKKPRKGCAWLNGDIKVEKWINEELLKDRKNWKIEVSLLDCPLPLHPYPDPRKKVYHDIGHPLPEDKITWITITGSGTKKDPYVVSCRLWFYCTCVKPPQEVGALIPPGQTGYLVTSVAVRGEEKVQVAQQIGGHVVAQVIVNDKPQELPKPDEGITVHPGDAIQLISTVGDLIGQFTFVPEDKTPPPSTPPVVECPQGKPAVVSVPGKYAGTPITDMAVTTGPVLAPGPEEVPAVTALGGGPEQVPATAVGGLQPVLKTDDTVVAAGQLDNSAIGSNAISIIDKTTGAVLGQAQIDMWRLAGASLNPPVVNKGQETNLRLDVFGPPDLQLEVTATAGEGLTPKQLTATAPISVLQKQGLGAFTATKSGTHNVSVKALPIIYGKGEMERAPAPSKDVSPPPSGEFINLCDDLTRLISEIVRRGPGTNESYEDLVGIGQRAGDAYRNGRITEEEYRVLTGRIGGLIEEVANPESPLFRAPPPEAAGRTQVFSLPPRSPTRGEILFDLLRQVRQQAYLFSEDCRYEEIQRLINELLEWKGLLEGASGHSEIDPSYARNAISRIERIIHELEEKVYQCKVRRGVLPPPLSDEEILREIPQLPPEGQPAPPPEPDSSPTTEAILKGAEKPKTTGKD